MRRSAFPRIARQMNYTREFPAPGKSRVDIPCLPYEAFDASGTMILPHSLFQFFESARAYTFWENTSKQVPDQSMCDMQTLLWEHLVFILGGRVHIQREFHNLETKKWPLYVSTALTQVGNSSKTLTYELRHAQSDVLFSSCDIIDVLVNGQTRKPMHYPDWWLEKYQKLCQTRKADMPRIYPSGQNALRSTVGVTFSDTDTYKHTNWSAYIKFCYDSLRQNIAHGHFATLAPCVEDGGIRTIEMTYKQESLLGDALNVVAWRNETDDKSVHFNVLKGEVVCFGCKMDFYEPQKSTTVTRSSL